MRHVFIVNPMAGKRNSVQHLLEQIRRLLPRNAYEAYPTTAAGDARRMALEAARVGYVSMPAAGTAPSTRW